MLLEELEPGHSWACRFKTTTFLDSQGQPVTTQNLQQGQAHPGTPGEYTSVGIILVRDCVNQRVQLQDTQSNLVFTVAWDSCWDADTIEWVDKL
jgi:hypothetical protein